MNDNAPAIVERVVEFCNDETVPVLLTVIDKDDVVNGAPYRVELKGESASNWTARMNDTSKAPLRLVILIISVSADVALSQIYLLTPFTPITLAETHNPG